MLLYDGTGRVDLAGDALVTSRTPNRYTVTITPASGFYVRVVNTSAADPLRNIRIVPAAYEATHAQEIFHPRFMQSVTGERSRAQWCRRVDTVTSGRARGDRKLSSRGTQAK